MAPGSQQDFKPQQIVRRLQNIEPFKGLEKPSSRPSFLPVELASTILELCEKSDLKVLRLVSRDWNAAATPFLFDRVWISPREVDLVVFRNITNDSNLSCHVRTLIYDATHFDEDLKPLEYVVQISEETPKRQNKSSPDSHPWCRLPEWYSCLPHGDAGGLSFDDFKNPIDLRACVREAYDEWLRLAKFEQDCVQSGAFLNALYIGLNQLPYLDSFVYDREMWRSLINNADKHINPASAGPRGWNFGSLSPLARS